MTKMKSCVISLATLALVACGSETVDKPMPLKSVKTLEVSDSQNISTRTISGTLDSASTSELSFRVGGLIELINVQAGDTVVAGDVVARISQRDYKLKLDAAQARLNSARSNYSEKESELTRQKQLFSRGFVANAAVEQAQAAFNQATSDVAVAEADLNTANNELSYTVLKTPISGTVAQRLAEPFAEVTAGQTIFEIQAGNALEVDVLVPETMINDISFGYLVSVSIPSVDVAGLPGTISEIGNTSIGGNAFSVSVRLNGTNDEIRPGMSARVGFNQIKNDSGVFLIPLTALDTRVVEQQQDNEKRQANVFVLENGTAVRRTVTIQDLDGNSLQVIDGLSAGDKLIVAGVSFIDEGQKVTEWKPNYNLPAVIEQ
jgi:RND family efflux transporter MFP subunit